MSIGLAGWANPPAHKQQRDTSQSHLEYYAAHFPCVEINSSFYRHHRAATYTAWRDATPAAFRFAVKMPRSITHDAALEGADEEIDVFFSGVSALQPKLAVILVQLPPSFEFDAGVVRNFFASLPRLAGVHLACEPRHATWFTGVADSLLERAGVSRVASDPAKWPGGDGVGGDKRFQYFRWHGSPTMYYSSYTADQLEHFAGLIDVGVPTWCMFDNTARYAAWDNARSFDLISAATYLRRCPS